MKNHLFDAVIVAGGEFPTTPQPLEVLQSASYVVCCDGAADRYIATGSVPDAIVGDGDSIPAALKAQCRDILFLEAEQETNDQTKAVKFLIERGFRRIAIVGATGKREDHTIGNLSLPIEYMRLGMEVRTYTDYGVFVPCRDTHTFPCRPEQQVSIFNFTAHGLRAQRLAYPLYDFTTWWQGTLNECTGNELTIHAQGEYILFMNY